MDERAISIVTEYIKEHLDKSDEIPIFEVYTVWKVKALQNWKYLLSSNQDSPFAGQNTMEKKVVSGHLRLTIFVLQ